MTENEIKKLTIFLAFANSKTHPLTELEVELEGIRDVISWLDAANSTPISLQLYGKVNLTRMSNVLSQYRESLYLFHFAGHANGELLKVEDGDASGDGLAGLLAGAKNLKLVFLNGCATIGHVERLFKAEIPAVIATSAKVGDSSATKFSLLFYEEFVDRHRTLEDAFTTAKNRLIFDHKIENRDIAIRDTIPVPNDQPNAPTPWGLYLNPMYNRSQILDWQLAKFYDFNKVESKPTSTMLNPPPNRNPYIVGSPIKESKHFFGREELLNDILGFDGQQLCILGVRRIGKTSLLRQIEERFFSKNQKIAIYLNLQGLKSADEIGKELQRNIQKMATKHPTVYRFQLPSNVGHVNDIIRAWGDFCLEKEIASMLLLDEAEQLECLNPAELGIFNSLINRNSCISLVITGSRFLRRLKMVENGLVSFLNAFEVRILRVFEKREVSDLVSQNGTVNVEPDISMGITINGGHHPFLMQFIAHKLYKEGRLVSFDENNRALTLTNDLALIFEDEFTRLTDLEKQIMLVLDFETPTAFNALQNNPALQQIRLKRDLNELEEFGFIKSDQAEYFLNNIFWKQYLDLDAIRLPQEEKNTTKSSSEEKITYPVLTSTEEKTPTLPTIFISHHSADTHYLSRLKVHLAVTKAKILDESALPIGGVQDEEMETFINSAKVILLLLSPDYLVDEQKIQEREAVKAIVAKSKKVIPILAKDCGWEDEFGKIVILPRDKKPLDRQPNLDAALTDITKSIRQVFDKAN